MSTDVVLCRLCVGHEAQRLDKETEDHRTHQWKAFVRSPDGFPDYTDRSFIKRVTFVLHESYKDNKRVVKAPPFEISETAYGGFDMVVIIQFQGISKPFPINYEITLPMEKEAHLSLEQFIEVKMPPKEFVDLALKYGGRLKRVAEKSKHHSETERPKKHKTSKSRSEPSTSSHKSSRDSDREHKERKHSREPKEHHSKEGKKHKKSHKSKSEKGEGRKRKHDKSARSEDIDLESVNDLFEGPHEERERHRHRERKEKSKRHKHRHGSQGDYYSSPKKHRSSARSTSRSSSAGDSQQPCTSAAALAESRGDSSMMDTLHKFSSLPNVLSPLQRPSTSKDTSSDAIKSRVDDIMKSLYVPVDKEKNKLPELREHYQLPSDYVSNFERDVPRLPLEDQYFSLPSHNSPASNSSDHGNSGSAEEEATQRSGDS